MNTQEEYVTSEFPLATTLLCMQVNLVGLRPSKDDTGRIEFIFDKNELVEKLIAGFWEGSLRLEPKQFWNQIKELKSRIRSQA